MEVDHDALQDDLDPKIAGTAHPSDGTTRRWEVAGYVGRMFMVLIGLCAFAASLYLWYDSFHTIHEYRHTRKWMESQAFLSKVELKYKRGDRDYRYEVIAEYSYLFNDRIYSGERVGLNSGADSFDSWQKDVFTTLYHAVSDGRSVPCYVDPAHPEKALLNRDIRLSYLGFHLCMSAVFAPIGLVTAWMSVASAKDKFVASRQRRIYPDQPWRQVPAWTNHTLSPFLVHHELLAWIVAIPSFIGSVPMLYVVPTEVWERNNRSALVWLLIPIVSLCLIAWAIQCTRKRRRFGMSRLNLATLPGVIGGELRGIVRLLGRIEGLDSITMRLECIHTYTRGKKHPIRCKDVLHSDHIDYKPAIIFGQSRLDVPFLFRIPDTCPPCEPDHSVSWQLLVTSSTPGLGLSLSFQVPVYRIAYSKTHPVVAEQTSKQELPITQLSELLPKNRIVARRTAEGFDEFEIPSSPGLLPMASLIGIGGVCLGVAFFSLFQISTGLWLISLFLFVLFAGMGGFMLFTVRTMLGSRRLTLAPDSVIVQRQLPGFRRSISIPLTSIRSVTFKCSLALPVGERIDRWFSVLLELHEGKTIVAGEHLPNAEIAAWFCQRIDRHVRTDADAAS